jgi:hypothetical protein
MDGEYFIAPRRQTAGRKGGKAIMKEQNTTKGDYSMNKLTVFKNDSFGSVRVIEREGEPWFVGKDVAEVLGYENPTKAIRDHVDAADKLMGVQNVTPSIKDALGRDQFPTWINESGLYCLIIASKLPNAHQQHASLRPIARLPAVSSTQACGQQHERLRSAACTPAVNSPVACDQQPKCVWMTTKRVSLESIPLILMARFGKEANRFFPGGEHKGLCVLILLRSFRQV